MEGKEREISLVLGKTDLRARLAQVLEMDDRASKQKHFEYELSRSDHRCGCVSSRSSSVNCHESRLAIHIKVLVLAMLLSRD